ncbi:hypothetical protein ACSX1A_05740 [Pontibacter sp. MBLB2868]|uniref:hypothetical protein n=1 Tax=Pontibacter sp. MBLB2868 TaxID=3451555 RepID=UPI003F752A72
MQALNIPRKSKSRSSRTNDPNTYVALKDWGEINSYSYVRSESKTRLAIAEPLIAKSDILYDIIIGNQSDNLIQLFEVRNFSQHKIEVPNHPSIVISTELKSIYEAVEESRYILDLEEGWDDENAKEISIISWYRTISFLVNYSSYIFDTYQLKISAPEINPCRDGSIDLSWRTNTARMLINISNADNMIASYYADKYNSLNSIEGLVETDKVQEFLASWMKYLV